MPTTFAQLGVPSFVSDALARRGITEPFEIQALTIADMLAGRDVCGRAPTGSGKTLAFGVPVVATTERSAPNRPQALILAPTRELAEQITSELRTFAGRLRIDAVYGGVGYGHQISALRRGVDVLVACPGRLEDLMSSGHVVLDAVRCVVLDEADRMADMGFMPAVRRLLSQTPSDRQTVLFSATLDGDVAAVTRDYQRQPVRHEVGDATPDVKSATHLFWKVAKDDRTELLADVVRRAWPAIVFTRTRHGADRLVKQLARYDVECVALHGGLSQSQRNRALASFSAGRVNALIATDVAARGIHVDGVAAVVHFDQPEDHKAYVHRSGRTARAGAGGTVVSLIAPDQMKGVRRMQREVGLDELIVSPDLAVIAEVEGKPSGALAPAEPAVNARQRQQRSDRPARADRSDRAGYGGYGDRSDRAGYQPRPDRGSTTDRAWRAERTESSPRSDRAPRGEAYPNRTTSTGTDRYRPAERAAGTDRYRPGGSDRSRQTERPASADRSSVDWSPRPKRAETGTVGSDRFRQAERPAPADRGSIDWSPRPKRSESARPAGRPSGGGNGRRSQVGKASARPNRAARRAHLQTGPR